MPVTRTSLPGGAVVAIVKRWRARRLRRRGALLRRALDRRPPGRREHRRQREDREQRRAPGGSTSSSAIVTPRRRIHPHVENTDMYMWSSTNTWLRSIAEPIEIVGPLLVRDRRDRGLQPRDVRLERDRDLVAEAALHARADGAQEPGRGGRDAERRWRRCSTQPRSPCRARPRRAA